MRTILRQLLEALPRNRASLAEFVPKYGMILVAMGIWGVYLLFSLMMSKQRVCHVDSAFYMFNVIQGDLSFITPRPAALLTLSAPIVATWLGLSLKLTMMAYSAAFGLLYGAIGLFTYRLVPTVNTIFVMTLVPLVATFHTFFNPANEATLALVLSTSFMCVYADYRAHPRRVAATSMVVLVVLSVLAHPSSILLIGLAVGIAESVHRFRAFPLKTLALAGVLAIISAVLTIALDTNDGNQFKSLSSMLNFRAFGFTRAVHGIDYFFYHLGESSYFYVPCALLWAVGIILLLMERHWIAAATVFVALPLVIVLNGNMNIEGESALVTEKGLLPIVLVVLAPYLIIRKIDSSQGRTILMAGLLLVGLVRFQELKTHGHWYFLRMERLLILIDDTSSPKVLMDTKTCDPLGVYLLWNTGIETLLYTTIQGDNPRTLFVTDDRVVEQWISEQGIFLGPDFNPLIRISDLNAKYLKLSESPYTDTRPAAEE